MASVAPRSRSSHDKLPPLLLSRPPGAQMVVAVVVPLVLGVICGLILGISGTLYTVLTLLIFPATILAGLEHEDSGEAVKRGFAGGLLFGTFILLAHSLSGAEPKTDLPQPHISLVIVTTLAGMIACAIGASLRRRLVYGRGGQPPAR